MYLFISSGVLQIMPGLFSLVHLLTLKAKLELTIDEESPPIVKSCAYCKSGHINVNPSHYPCNFLVSSVCPKSSSTHFLAGNFFSVYVLTPETFVQSLEYYE